MWCSGRKRAKQNPTNVSREKEIAYSGTPVKNGRKRFRGYGEWIENRTEKRQGSEERKKRRVIRGRKKRERETEYRNREERLDGRLGKCTIARKRVDKKKKTGSKKFVRVSRRRTEKRKVECKWEVLKAGDKEKCKAKPYLPRCQYALSFQQCNQRRLLYWIYWKSYCSVRTLDVILTTANSKPRRAARAEEKGEGREMRARYAKSCSTSQNEAAEHPSFPNSRVVRVRKEESFNGITERFQAEGRA